MYDVNEVTEVNKSYIFFTFKDGSQDRNSVDLKQLEELNSILQNELFFYSRMEKELQEAYDSKNEELGNIEESISTLESQIEKRSNEPSIKRGLNDINYQLYSKKEEYHEIACMRSGIAEQKRIASTKYWKYYKIKKQCEGVL